MNIDSDSVPQLPFDMAQPYAPEQAEKRLALTTSLLNLGKWHSQHCTPYAEMVSRLFPASGVNDFESLPFLPVRLFKSLDLRSVQPERVIKTLTSSGTTGQAVSTIYLDKETSVRQTRVLSAIMASFLGKQRWPMVIIDSKDLVKDRSRFNARAAGILGFSTYGRRHFYCLDDQLQLDVDGLREFAERHHDQPVFLFGFTFIVWQNLVQAARDRGIKLNFHPDSLLLHGGGWKRLQDQAVSNAEFKQQLLDQFGLKRVHNYYGMVEQVGSIFMECENGHLHCPSFAEILIRDPHTLLPLPNGREGVVQVMSAIPLSYPGHSLLTEDLGTVHGEDDCKCGRMGKYFSVSGRLPQVEMRGCSDTRAV